jgi:surface antigen
MDGNTAQLYAVAEREGLLHHNPIPTIGDLVFFDNTHDRNRNGQWDDERTHIAVVVDVDPDGTITLAHHGSERALVSMNLLPERILEHEGADGKLYNSYLRRKSIADGKWELNLTGELWAAFAHPAADVDWEIP